jgi:hypothetical protein
MCFISVSWSESEGAVSEEVADKMEMGEALADDGGSIVGYVVGLAEVADAVCSPLHVVSSLLDCILCQTKNVPLTRTTPQLYDLYAHRQPNARSSSLNASEYDSSTSW